jgi:hypothetical protein
MKTFAFVASLLLLLCAAFATNYTADYTAGNWLKVTRTIQVQDDDPCFANAVSNTCINTGSVSPSVVNGTHYGYATKVTLTVQNIGSLLREGISIGENVNYVPAGAKLTYYPRPNTTDGRQAYWQLGSLKPGESKNVSYEFSATLVEGNVKKVGAVSILSEPVMVSLLAPTASKVGERLSLALKTPSGQPVSGAIVYVEAADGSSQAVKTDSAGVASFIARFPGYYTYSVDEYKLSGTPSTQVRLDEESSAVAAAAVADNGLLQGLAGIFPMLAAIFVIAVVALIIYNFLASRKEEGEAYSQPSPVAPAAAAAAPTYTQKFTFAQASSQDEKIREATRDILESRKKQLKQEAEAGQDALVEHEAEPEQEQPAFSELDQKVAQMEAEARQEGESAQEEDEIEKAIAELEAIREKLRAGREDYGSAQEAQAASVADSEASEADQEPEQKRPVPKKPSYGKRAEDAKAPASKPKKMKFSSHGIRKK